MSSETPTSFTRRGAAFGLIALAGCGFTPVYGPGGAGGQLQNSVAFTTPQTEFGFRLRTALEDRFGIASPPTFTVDLALKDQRSAAAVTVDGDTTRFDITGSATWTLRSIESAASVNGEVQTFTSYSATGSTVATQAAERDARARLAQALADMIAADLVLAIGSLS